MLKVRLRPAQKQDFIFLKIFLYDAIFIPEGIEPLPFSIINDPQISKYIKGWKRKTDIGIIAETEEGAIGGIWARFFSKSNQGYGYISDDIPELSMSVLEEYRNIGIGSELLTSLFNELRNRRIAKVSLSVDKRNKAFNFYKRNGFIISEELDYSVKMIKEL